MCGASSAALGHTQLRRVNFGVQQLCFRLEALRVNKALCLHDQKMLLRLKTLVIIVNATIMPRDTLISHIQRPELARTRR